jgi:hypothetical protein
VTRKRHDRAMQSSLQLSSTLSWLVDLAAETSGADRLLAELGAHLVADGLPLAGGALTLDIPHPLIARRTWLWRAGSGEESKPWALRRADPSRPWKKIRPMMQAGNGLPGSPVASCMRTALG